MTCPNCNAQNDDNANVCINCGELLDTEENISELSKSAQLEEIKSRRLRKKKIQKRKKIVLACIVTAILLGAAAYGLFTIRDNFLDRTGADEPVIIASPSPAATEESTAEPSAEPTEVPTIAPTEETAETLQPTATQAASWAPASTAAPTPKATKKPAAAPTKKPAQAAITPVVSSPGFAAGSTVQAAVPQGSAISSTLVSVNAVETASYSGKSIAVFSIGNETYYAYAQSSAFANGVPAMYSIDAVATEDTYYGLPVYTITKIDSYDANGYILPDSSARAITESDLEGLSKAQLDLARNEIFARHGRIFKRQEVQKYFESKSWYKVNNSYNYVNDYSNLSEIELKNAKFILEYENK